MDFLNYNVVNCKVKEGLYVTFSSRGCSRGANSGA